VSPESRLSVELVTKRPVDDNCGASTSPGRAARLGRGADGSTRPPRKGEGPNSDQSASSRRDRKGLLDAVGVIVTVRGFFGGTLLGEIGETRRHDNNPIHDGCEARDCHPVFPLRQTVAVERGDHKSPRCEHGVWTFAGADYQRNATKWRCPTSECKPASRWIKASRLRPLIPRETKRWSDLYRGRDSVERALPRRSRRRAPYRSRRSGLCHPPRYDCVRGAYRPSPHPQPEGSRVRMPARLLV
jgi:hypothetical protein